MTMTRLAVVGILTVLTFGGGVSHADEQEESAKRAIRELGGVVKYDTSPEGIALAIAQVPGPVRVILFASKVTDKDLRWLKALKRIRVVDLTYTKVTDAGLAELGGVEGLERLYLSSTRVKGPGLRGLKGLKGLRALRLAHTLVSDSDLAALEGLDNLRQVDLSGTRITNQGVDYLNNLPNLQHRLEELDVGKTQVGNQALPGNETVPSLNKLERLWYLSLSGTQVDDDWLDVINEIRNLRELHLRHTKVTNRGLRDFFISDWLKDSLQYLDVSETAVGDDGLSAFAKELELEALDASYTQVTGAGVARLAKECDDCLSNLVELYLYDTRVTDADLRNLYDAGVLQHLTLLELSGTQVTDGGLEVFSRRQRDVAVRGAAAVGLGVLPLQNTLFVAALPLIRENGGIHLTSLFISGTRVKGPGLTHLRGLRSSLHEFSFSRNKVADEKWLHEIRELSNLTDLYLEDLAVTDADDVVFDLAKDLRHLEYLYLHGTKVTEEALARLRHLNPNLSILP